ncbi:MAG: HAD family phosphatase [Clostridia bacterium]|nr:HAD family phosphatase [Clostridia bacterium]
MQTFLFDFDGTLVDSMPVYADMMLGILDEFGVAHEESVIKTITPLGYRGAAKHFISLGLDMPEDDLVRLMHERAVQAYSTRVAAKPFVPEALRALHARGDSLSVLTASPHAMLDPCLKRLGLYDLFDHVWSCEDFSMTKSEPEIYVKAAQRLEKPVSDVWFLDDNPGADAAAKAAGMRVCGVYDDSSSEYEQEMRRICDAYITDFSQLDRL